MLRFFWPRLYPGYDFTDEASTDRLPGYPTDTFITFRFGR